jgi:undecaprenyl-diphosphatase
MLVDFSKPAYKPLLLGLFAALLLLAFNLIGGVVAAGDTRGLDLWLTRSARELRLAHPWVADAMRDLSGLGSEVVLCLLVAMIVGYLLLRQTVGMALLVGTAAFTGGVSVLLLKTWFGRLRPGSAFAEIAASGLSFPSGHATMSATVFLTAGALLASARAHPIERTYILGAAVLLSGLVGLSRVALGVHWATDVLAGWVFGSAWAIGWLLLAHRLWRRQVRL